MPLKTLSSHLRLHPEDIDRSLQKLTCTSKSIAEVDIHPSALWRLVAEGSNEVRGVARAYTTLWTGKGYPNAHAVGMKPFPDGEPRQLNGLSPSSTTSPPPSDTTARPGEETHMNLAIAFSLHTVLLSRNRLTQTLGCVQFRNVVRLSLLGNGIRRVADCEPLGLLAQLAYLSLEFNPVAALPHYRAHLLRICSFPGPLEEGRCRLRKLDGAAVRRAEVAAAAVCLQREAVLLPELLGRRYLGGFLVHVEATMGVQAEMRRLGLVVGRRQPERGLDGVVKHCARAALGRCGIHETAHATQLLIARSLKEFKKNPQDASLGDASDPAQRSAFSSSLTVEGSVGTRTALDGSTISVLDETSEIVLEDLRWSKDSLRNAEAARTSAACKVCSQAAFRRLVSILDVRLCACLLRIARLLGVSLLSKDVDALCEMWLSTALSTEETTLADIYAKKTLDEGNRMRRHSSGARSIKQEIENQKEMNPTKASKEDAQSLSALKRRPGSLSLASPSEKISPREESIPEPELACELFPEKYEDVLEEKKLSMPSTQLREQTLSSASSDASEKRSEDWKSPVGEEGDERSIQMKSDLITKPTELAEFTPVRACQMPFYPSPDESHLEKNILEALNSKPNSSNSCTNGSSKDEESRIKIVLNAHHVVRKKITFGIWRKALLRRNLLRNFYQSVSTRMKDAPILQRVSNLSMLRFVFDLSYLERKRVFFAAWRHRKEEIRMIRHARQRVLLCLWWRRARSARLCRQMHYERNRRRAEGLLNTWKRRALLERDRRFRESQTKALQGAPQTPPAMTTSLVNGKNQDYVLEGGEEGCFVSHICEQTPLQRGPFQLPASNATSPSSGRFAKSVQPSSSPTSFPPTERKKATTPPAHSHVERALAVEDAMAHITIRHPFSEDDVAALVEKASFLLRDREVLVKLVVDQLVECEKARAVSRWLEKRVETLQEDVKKCMRREEEERRVRTEYEIELKHLRKCVEELREERREWIERFAPR